MIDLNEKTVIELRKLAKEMQVPLGAGISKAGIIEKLSQALAAESPAASTVESAAPQPAEVPADEPAAEPAEEAPAEPPAPEVPDAPQAVPGFRQAYAAPQRFNSKPAYQAPTYNRSGPRPAPAQDGPRTQTRATGFAPRFGPAAMVEPAPAPAPVQEEERPAPIRPAASDAPRFPQRPAFEQKPAFESRPAFEQKPAFESRPAYDAPRPAYERSSYDRPRRDPPSSEAAPVYSTNPTVNELIAPAEMPECTGVLDLMPEGYGFLRGESLISTGKDVYVSAAQVKRFSLRTGDRITGRMRPAREGDKYPALLVASTVNGNAADSAAQRPAFDDLTPIYPRQRINLEGPYADVRLMDLVTPIGFGQRGLLQCGPRTGKTRLLQHLANIILRNHPDAQVMTLLYNENPEDVTLFREAVKCPVYATTFDMPPESHLKLTDMVLDVAQRQVELGRNVVLLVDSLTTLTKVISAAALQQGRVIPGMINPASLQKAKRLFGAARCLREGGSLTVIATMNIDSGTKADDSIVGEFRGAANMEMVLDQSLAKAGLYPPMVLAQSGTRRADAILTPEHQEGLKLLRGMLGRLTPDAALTDVLSMLEKAATNQDLLSRIKAWAASMQG